MSISMKGAVRATIDQIVGLVVDDGFVAVGAVVALLVTGWFATSGSSIVPTEALGMLLFVVVSIVLLASVARAGLGARAHAVPGAAPTSAQAPSETD